MDEREHNWGTTNQKELVRSLNLHSSHWTCMRIRSLSGTKIKGNLWIIFNFILDYSEQILVLLHLWLSTACFYTCCHNKYIWQSKKILHSFSFRHRLQMQIRIQLFYQNLKILRDFQSHSDFTIKSKTKYFKLTTNPYS